MKPKYSYISYYHCKKHVTFPHAINNALGPSCCVLWEVDMLDLVIHRRNLMPYQVKTGHMA